MSMTGIFDTTIQALDKVLELRTHKLRAISSNIANAVTPGYSRIKVEFEDQLRGAVLGVESGQVRTHPQHMPSGCGDPIDSVRPHFTKEEAQIGRAHV